MASDPTAVIMPNDDPQVPEFRHFKLRCQLFGGVEDIEIACHGYQIDENLIMFHLLKREPDPRPGREGKFILAQYTQAAYKILPNTPFILSEDMSMSEVRPVGRFN